MGWLKTDVEGRVMWERSDGVRVRCSDDIEAIEAAEEKAFERTRIRALPRYDFEIEEEIEYEPLCFVGRMVVLGLIAGILIFMLIVCKFSS